MCGIVGSLDFSGDGSRHANLVRAMVNILRHRGPDDEGFYTDGPIHFGFRRLSILDLSPAGHQPMASDDGRYHVIFNGEIYNYLELREELKRHGHVFHTGSDTEVILKAYGMWGPDCVERFNGMWGLAIWDSKEQTLFCSRDRFGVKPFYYTVDGRRFLFASEIKALLADRTIARRPNMHRVYDYLVYGYLDHTDETFFLDIKQLPPAHSLTINAAGHMKIFRHWDLDIQRSTTYANPQEYADRFLELFRDSIRLRLRSDVAVGTCLSGGLDSSAIVCIVNDFLRQEKLANIGDRQKTFSAAYEEKEADEREYSQEVVAKTGAAQFLIFPTSDDVRRDLDRVVYHQDEPFGSTSIFAQWYVMKRAHEEGMKVMLDGQGGDESLAGYDGYFGPHIASLLTRLRLLSVNRELRSWQRNHGLPTSNYLYHVMVGVVMKLMPSSLARLAIRAGKADGSLYLLPEFISRYSSAPPRLSNSYRDPLKNELHRVLRIGLPALLHYEDRNSMAWSIEARVPFLDYRLVEYLFSIPNEQKIHDGTTKVVLRRAMKGILPEKVRMRQNKYGFNTPEVKWLKQLEPIASSVLTSRSFADRGIFTTEHVQKYFQQVLAGERPRFVQSPIVWRWINLELWWREFIDHP